LDYYKKSLKMHEEYKGKMEMKPKVRVNDKNDLSIAYTPGVAEPCKKIKEKPENIYKYTNKSNTVAVVSDGSAVLGLGNIGAEAAIPVMDGKALLFKKFAGIDAVPICIKSQDSNEIVNIVKNISPMFGGINLEDISAPRCFEIEKNLQKAIDIPVFHDDQHGTAIVVSAATINSARLTGIELKEMKVVINGCGAAGTAIAKMLMGLGINDLVVCDSKGILSKKRSDLNKVKKELVAITNHNNLNGSLKEAIKGRNLFVGVSTAKVADVDMVKSMAENSIVFAMANPEPEILPKIAKEAKVSIFATGRSDYPNQINNLLAFSGVFKGALSVRAKKINEEMKIAAAYALARMIDKKELASDNIIPEVFMPEIVDRVADAVAKAYRK